MSHLDVVPPGDLDSWDTDPFTLVQKDDELYGRGTEDNQQGLVSSLGAALAFLRLGIKPKYHVQFAFLFADEEVGSKYGIIFIFKENHNIFGKNDLICVSDAEIGKDALLRSQKNETTVKVHTRGVQTHASPTRHRQMLFSRF